MLKVFIRNYTKKARSLKQRNELKAFVHQMTKELGIDSKIKSVTLQYKNDWGRAYYPKNKPLGGFSFLLKKGHVRIILTKFWDEDQRSRKEGIIHELTHTKQLITNKLVLVNDKEVLWKNKPYSKWKNFRFATLDKIKSEKKKEKYLVKHFPWEKEVRKNIAFYNFPF